MTIEEIKELDSHTKMLVHEQYVKEAYMEDIENEIELSELDVPDSLKRKILEKYFEMRENAEYSWRTCLENSFTHILGFDYIEKYEEGVIRPINDKESQFIGVPNRSISLQSGFKGHAIKGKGTSLYFTSYGENNEAFYANYNSLVKSKFFKNLLNETTDKKEVRFDSEVFSYLIQLVPNDTIPVRMFCYEKDKLDKLIKESL